MGDNLPTEKDINPFNSDLDEQAAVKSFLGKTREDALEMFCRNALAYSEDLMVMGDVAFDYYFPAYCAYLVSERSKDDSDGLSCFVSIVEFRWECTDWQWSPQIRNTVAACAQHCIENEAKFQADPTIYGDLPGKLAHIKSLMAQTGK